MKIFDVDMESATDPYGEGVGFTIIVIAKNAKHARIKANKYWKTKHPWNKTHAYDDFRAFKIKQNNDVVR